MVKSLKLQVFYKVAVNTELANTEWLLWEETQGLSFWECLVPTF